MQSPLTSIQVYVIVSFVHSYLRIVSAVGRERFGDDEKRVGKGLNSELGSSLDLPLVGEEGVGGGDLKGTRTRHHGAVFQCVFDGAEPVAHGVLQLRQRVFVGALYKVDENAFVSENSKRDLNVTLLQACFSAPKSIFKSRFRHPVQGQVIKIIRNL